MLIKIGFAARILRLHPSRSISFCTQRFEYYSSNAVTVGKRIKAFIFDKDGTLINFHSLWLPWLHKICSSLKDEIGINVSNLVFPALGVDQHKNKIRSGLLAEGTCEQIHACIKKIVCEHTGNDEHEHTVKRIFTQHKDHSHPPEPIGDIKKLLSTLKSKGYKIALNTSDSRNSTLRNLHFLNIANDFDKIVCGDDEDLFHPKPHPHSAIKICDALNVRADEAVMIGDTGTDLDLARNANLGLGVGVLSGIGTEEDLRKHSPDIIIETVHDIGALF